MFGLLTRLWRRLFADSFHQDATWERGTTEATDRAVDDFLDGLSKELLPRYTRILSTLLDDALAKRSATERPEDVTQAQLRRFVGDCADLPEVMRQRANSGLREWLDVATALGFREHVDARINRRVDAIMRELYDMAFTMAYARARGVSRYG